MRITPENIGELSQEQVDQIYGRLTAGPIPDGQYSAICSLRAATPSRRSRLAPRSRFSADRRTRSPGAAIEVLEELGRELWKGKVFFREQRVLRNMIEDSRIRRSPTIPLLMTTTVPTRLARSARLPNNTVWLLFPAKLYCGQSLVDGRRESIIVDYNYSDEIEGYRESPDSLAGRGGCASATKSA